MGKRTDNLAGRARLTGLLRRLGGPDPVASALAESEVRALGPAILPEIEAILATRVTGIEDILRTAAQAIIGSGIIASAFESVRENPRYWLPIAGAALLAAGAIALLLIRAAAADRCLRRGVARAVRALDDPRGAGILLGMARSGLMENEGAQTLAGLLRRSPSPCIPGDAAIEEGLAAALAYPHHDLRMACLAVLEASGRPLALDALRRLARMRADSAAEIQEKEEARRVYVRMTGKEP